MTFEELQKRVEEIESRNKKPAKRKNTFREIGVYDGLEETRRNVTKAYAKLNKLTMCI